MFSIDDITNGIKVVDASGGDLTQYAKIVYVDEQDVKYEENVKEYVDTLYATKIYVTNELSPYATKEYVVNEGKTHPSNEQFTSLSDTVLNNETNINSLIVRVNKFPDDPSILVDDTKLMNALVPYAKKDEIVNLWTTDGTIISTINNESISTNNDISCLNLNTSTFNSHSGNTISFEVFETVTCKNVECSRTVTCKNLSCANTIVCSSMVLANTSIAEIHKSSTTVAPNDYTLPTSLKVQNMIDAIPNYWKLNDYDAELYPVVENADFVNIDPLSLKATYSYFTNATITNLKTNNILLDKGVQEYYIKSDSDFDDPNFNSLILTGTTKTRIVINSVSGTITLTSSNIKLDGTVTYTSSLTITHFCPIEEDIVNYVLGAPVFLSGKVYKRNDTNWIESTSSDSIDCICSVKSTGTWKEYVGVCCEVSSDKEIKFATHGDFLFKVDDSSLYEIGDTILYDGKILDEDYAITLKITRSIVGVVSGIIDKNNLAIFRD